MDGSNKTMVVLGMHRSATSLVAKGLHEAGVNMGDNLLMHGRGNPEGHYEDGDFIALNDAMLTASDGSWRCVPRMLTDRYDTLVEQLVTKKDEGLWGWKDPRTTLTIEKYYDHLEDPILVCCFRKPEKVGQSLKARGDMKAKQGEELARQYNRKLIEFLQSKFT